MNVFHEENILVAYGRIRELAPRWLEICGFPGLCEFGQWLLRTQATIIAFDGGYLILNEYIPGARITIHPCFFDVKVFHREELFEELFEFLENLLDVRRYQIEVFSTAGHAIRRQLQKSHFVKEASLQNYALDYSKTPSQLISVEIWAILK